MKLEPALIRDLDIGDNVWTQDGQRIGQIVSREELTYGRVCLRIELFQQKKIVCDVAYLSDILVIDGEPMYFVSTKAANLPPNVQINTAMMQTSAPPPTEDLPLTWGELKEGMQVRTASNELLDVVQIGLVFFKINVMFKKANGSTVVGDGDPLDLASIGNEFLYQVKSVKSEAPETSKAYDPMDEYQTKYSTEW